MITYESRGFQSILNVFKMSGSVFPRAAALGFPAGVLTLILRAVFDANTDLMAQVLGKFETAVWTGFTMFVGFFIVFRTSIAYARFWQGCTSSHRMGAEWLNACSALCSFTATSKAGADAVQMFKYKCVLLFNLLHAVALAEVEDGSVKSDTNASLESFKIKMIDAGALDDESLIQLRDCPCKVALVFQWVQQLVVFGQEDKVLSVPPPLLTRALVNLDQGMAAFNDMALISSIPFPFPYTQTCDLLLLLHFFTTPIVCSQWVEVSGWAGFFAFLQVFVMWCLKFIAVELENPFGADKNDIDDATLQYHLNENLVMLMDPKSSKCPDVHPTRAKELLHHEDGHLTAPTNCNAEAFRQGESEGYRALTLYGVWEAMADNGFHHTHVARSCRKYQREWHSARAASVMRVVKEHVRSSPRASPSYDKCSTHHPAGGLEDSCSRTPSQGTPLGGLSGDPKVSVSVPTKVPSGYGDPAADPVVLKLGFTPSPPRPGSNGLVLHGGGRCNDQAALFPADVVAELRKLEQQGVSFAL